MSGEGQQYSRRGITPRALHHIFEQIDIRVDRQMTVRVSFVEVYNEVCLVLCIVLQGVHNIMCCQGMQLGTCYGSKIVHAECVSHHMSNSTNL